jgi:uncharacterized protein (TIGR02246 family)
MRSSGIADRALPGNESSTRRTPNHRFGAAITVVGMTDASRTADLDELHGAILDAWNRQDAKAYAECFVDDALVIGFDGSQMRDRVATAEQLGGIFSDHQVATYVRAVRSVRRLDERTELLHAVVGMVPAGGGDVMPDRHAVQLLVGTRQSDGWRAVSFQNTPAQLHGRPEALDALTAELRTALTPLTPHRLGPRRSVGGTGPQRLSVSTTATILRTQAGKARPKVMAGKRLSDAPFVPRG